MKISTYYIDILQISRFNRIKGISNQQIHATILFHVLGDSVFPLNIKAVTLSEFYCKVFENVIFEEINIHMKLLFFDDLRRSRVNRNTRNKNYN